MYASALQNSNLSQMQSFKNGAFLKKKYYFALTKIILK